MNRIGNYSTSSVDNILKGKGNDRSTFLVYIDDNLDVEDDPDKENSSAPTPTFVCYDNTDTCCAKNNPFIRNRRNSFRSLRKGRQGSLATSSQIMLTRKTSLQENIDVSSTEKEVVNLKRSQSTNFATTTNSAVSRGPSRNEDGSHDDKLGFLRSFKEGGLKRTQTMSSIVSGWNKSFRQRLNERTLSFRNLDRKKSQSQFFTRRSTSKMSTSDLIHPPPAFQSAHPAQRFRIRGLSDIDPKFISQSGLCSSSELATSRGSIRIQHLTSGSGGLGHPLLLHEGKKRSSSAGDGRARNPMMSQRVDVQKDLMKNPTQHPTGGCRFPRLEDCAHFHYEYTEFGPITVELLEDQPPSRSASSNLDSSGTKRLFSVGVTSNGKCWILKRSLEHFAMLDKQCHQCVFDRKFSKLPEIKEAENVTTSNGLSHTDSVRQLLSGYLDRFSTLAGPVITCGPVLNWLELDNRGHRLLVTDDGAINTPAVAAAYAVRKYTKQAPDEISFEIGDMISVIDMPPPEESLWWRGKRGFEVGFFPMDCVEIIGDKDIPHHAINVSTTSCPPKVGGSEDTSPESSGASTSSEQQNNMKPVLRKHGKLISFFRSFILSRPSRGKLKKSGILKERVFGCDLSEHLLNTGQEVPKVLTHCAEFIEKKGIIDGIYRLSGIASNIQKLRVAFDEDRVPNLYEDKAVLQDIHSVSSLLKMYFRELPNPICTYHLYDKFVEAAKAQENQRLVLMRDVVQQLPPPNYRTLEYLSRHLYRVSLRGNDTGMTAKNVAIVWAPNLLRCKHLEVGGVAALQGVGVQAVVTEYLIRYCELIFSEKMPVYQSVANMPQTSTPKKQLRPKSLAISTPTKLLTLEEARTRALQQAAQDFTAPEQKYIDVGGGPENLPAKYHTVIELPGKKSIGIGRSGNAGNGSTSSNSSSTASGGGWKALFSGGKNKSKSRPKIDLNQDKQIGTSEASESSGGPTRVTIQRQSSLRPVRSAEHLVQQLAEEEEAKRQKQEEQPDHEEKVQMRKKKLEQKKSNDSSRPMSMDLDELAPLEVVQKAVQDNSNRYGSPAMSTKCHSRSSSHDSYFKTSMTSSSNTPNKTGSALDLSEIQMNFELEENEMKIFSEDEATIQSSTSMASSLSSPTDEKAKGMRFSPRGSKKMSSFKEKLKRFTSPTSNRKSIPCSSEDSSSQKSFKDKIVDVLSPDHSQKRKMDSVSKKKSSSILTSSPPEQIKRSKIEAKEVKKDETDEEEGEGEGKEEDKEEITVSNGIPLSPSINFIDDVNTNENTDAIDRTIARKSGKSKSNAENFRFSTASSTEEDFQHHIVQPIDVIAQVHCDPILEHKKIEVRESVKRDISAPDSPGTNERKISSDFSASLAAATVSENESLDITTPEEKSSIHSDNNSLADTCIQDTVQKSLQDVNGVPETENGASDDHKMELVAFKEESKDVLPENVNENEKNECNQPDGYHPSMNADEWMKNECHERAEEPLTVSVRQSNSDTVENVEQNFVRDEVEPDQAVLEVEDQEEASPIIDQDLERTSFGKEDHRFLVDAVEIQSIPEQHLEDIKSRQDNSNVDEPTTYPDIETYPIDETVESACSDQLKINYSEETKEKSALAPGYDESVVSGIPMIIDSVRAVSVDESFCDNPESENILPVSKEETALQPIQGDSIALDSSLMVKEVAGEKERTEALRPKSILIGPRPFVSKSPSTSPEVELRYPAGRVQQVPPVPKPRTVKSLPSPQASGYKSCLSTKSLSPVEPIPEPRPSVHFADMMCTKQKSLSSAEISTKKLRSTNFLQTSIEEQTENHMRESSDQPLQRRNSIHNVPFVDVNDPKTRERMERYKEERRSLLRAKYKVEDYVTKKISVDESKSVTPKVTLRKMTINSAPIMQKTSVGGIYKPEVGESTRKWSLPVSNKESSPPKPKQRSPVLASSKIPKLKTQDEISVRERAAAFGKPSSDLSMPRRRSPTNETSPGSPNKIRNMAAMFEQHN